MPQSCRFCSSNSLRLLFKANKTNEKQTKHFACTNTEFGSHGSIVKCDACEVIYVDDKTPQKKITTYYEVVEDPVYFEEQGAREKTFKKNLKNIEQLIPQKGKLLDIGTNTGLFVKLAKDSGWGATGLEPNKWAVDFAKKHYDLKLINQSFGRKTFKPDSFDVITMWDVIEHFVNPQEKAKNVFSFLKAGGLFAFSTVDPQSPLAVVFGTKWSWYMEMHRVFWSKKAAERELKKIGFGRIIFKPHFRYLTLGYLTTRAEALHPIISRFLGKSATALRVEKSIVPFYANDLYDCYAFK